MARVYIYIFAIWTIAWNIRLVQGVKEGLGVGIAIDQGAPDSIIAQKANDLILNCSVTFNSDLGDLKITWLKDGSPLDLSNKRIQLLENGSLSFRRVIHRPRKNLTDEGHYRCLATLVGVGRVIARDVRVQVAGIERKFDVEPQAQEAVVGGVARFQCQIRAVPPPIYVWEFNKNSLPQSDKRYFILNSGILQITGVRESDAGLYRCHAAQGSVHELPGKVSDIDEKYSTEASLTVKPGLQPLDVKIVASSGNVSTHIGSSVTLECLVQGLNGHAEWYKDGQKITRSIDGRMKRIGNNLQFMETILEDSGKYKCVADKVATETIDLTFINKPVILKGPVSVEEVSSKWQYLDCEAKGHPDPNITWYKDGNRLNLEDPSSNYRRGRLGHQLAIVQGEPDDSGYFQCFATNEAGSTSAFARLKFKVQKDAPGTPRNLRLIEATNSTIEVAWDPPKEQVLAYSVHYKMPKELADDKVVQNTQIKLTGLVPFSNYSISVGAYTRAGAGLKSRALFVQTKEAVPIKPVSVTLEARDTSILVSWLEMPVELRRGIIVGYRLYYRLRGKPESEEVVTTIPPTATSYLLTDLLPGTDYEVRMKAGTAVGYPSFNSDTVWPWIHETTELENNPLRNPPKVEILPINMTAVNVTWSLGESSNVKAFMLRLERLPAEETIKSAVLLSQDRHFALYQLDETVRYELTLVVKSTDDSEAKISKEFQTSDLPLVPRPTDLRVTLRGETSLQVTWVQPPSALEIEFFKVRYMPLNGKVAVYSYEKSNTNSALLTGLLENTVYNISVSAEGLDMRSLYSEAVLGKTSNSGVSVVPCDPAVTSCPTPSEAPQEGSTDGTNEPRLGIVIGVSIGLFCIMICILIIVLRNRCLSPHYNQQPMTQPARFHGNGHIPGNGNGHAVNVNENRRSVGVYEMDAYTPMLEHLPENEDSDSKGGGGGNVILTPNGAKLNGFVPMKKNGVKNGQNHNGHMVSSFLPNQYTHEPMDSEETRGLIAAMLNGGNGKCLTGRMGEDSFTTSRVDDLGSLGEIDHSSCEDMLPTSQERSYGSSGGDIGAGSSMHSHNDSSYSTTSDRHSESNSDSLPRAAHVRTTANNNNNRVDSSSGLRMDREEEGAELTAHDGREGRAWRNGDVPGGTTTCAAAADLCTNIPHSVQATVPHTSGTTGDGREPLRRHQSGVAGDAPVSPKESMIPHNQLSTSNKSQAGSDSGGGPRTTTGSSGTPPPATAATSSPHTTGVVTANGAAPDHPSIQNRDFNLDVPRRQVNGVAPHFVVRNGGVSQSPQGATRLVLEEINPSIPQSPLARETILSHGVRDITLDTSGQIPQDAVCSATVASAPPHHYQV